MWNVAKLLYDSISICVTGVRSYECTQQTNANVCAKHIHGVCIFINPFNGPQGKDTCRGATSYNEKIMR